MHMSSRVFRSTKIRHSEMYDYMVLVPFVQSKNDSSKVCPDYAMQRVLNAMGQAQS